MRYLIALMLCTAACTGVPSNGPYYDSVRDRLADTAWLFVHDEASSGAVTTRCRVHDDWITATSGFEIQRGYVRAGLDESGQLVIDQLEIEIAPIRVERVFGRSTQLQDVNLRLAAPVRGQTQWTSEDEASATLPMTFDVGSAIAFDGGEPLPLATRRMPPRNVEVVLAGDGDHIAASIEIDARGELWSWEDVVLVTEVSLSLTAETAN